ncbi:hypothetical protein Trydic_g4400 [Trypoxylus dichotomus]
MEVTKEICIRRYVHTSLGAEAGGQNKSNYLCNIWGNHSVIGNFKFKTTNLTCAILEPPSNYQINESPCASLSLDSTWRMLNRIQTGLVPVKTNKLKWKTEDQQCLCEYGEIQDMDHLLGCTLYPAMCCDEMCIVNNKAIDIVHYWAEKLTK